MNETLQRTQSDSAMAELSLSEKLRLVNDGGAFSFDIEVDISTVEKQEESIRIHIVPEQRKFLTYMVQKMTKRTLSKTLSTSLWTVLALAARAPDL